MRHWAAGRHCAPDDQTAPAESERPATPESARTPLAGPAARLELDTQPSAPGRKAGKAKGHADETNRISTFSVRPFACVSGWLFFGRLTVDSTIAGGTTQIAGISRIHTIFGGVGTL